MRAANTAEEEKSKVKRIVHMIKKIHDEIVKQAENHLLLATKARSYLKSQIATAKEEIKIAFVNKGLDLPPVGSSLPPLSHDISIHYSFDFAQQVNSFVFCLFVCLSCVTQ